MGKCGTPPQQIHHPPSYPQTQMEAISKKCRVDNLKDQWKWKIIIVKER